MALNYKKKKIIAVFHDDVAPEGDTVGRARAVLSVDISSFMGL